MPSVGPIEIAVLLIVALIIFGPKRLPEMGRSFGKGLREFRGSLTGQNDADETDRVKLHAGPEETSRAGRANEGPRTRHGGVPLNSERADGVR